MEYEVAYYDNGTVQHVTDEWHKLPKEDVLWVDVYAGSHKHVLLGGDTYWIHGNMYGMTYEWAQPRFGGVLYAAWRVVEGEFEYVGEVPPPEGAYQINGKGLPDDEWEELRHAN
jgi:hypothetical protein